jgi:hypothetical protein
METGNEQISKVSGWVFGISLIILVFSMFPLLLNSNNTLFIIICIICLTINIVTAIFCLVNRNAAIPTIQKSSTNSISSYQKEKIVILLPFVPTNDDLHEAQKNAIKDDCIAQLLGIYNFLKNDGQKYYDDFEFIFINHENKAEIAKIKAIKQLNKGVKYFFSTMSSVNIELSKFFVSNEMVKKNDSILLCTATSSMKLNLQKNRVYRFYPRCIEEGAVLADFIKKKQIKNVTSIVVGSNHGIETAKSLEYGINNKYISIKTITIEFGYSASYITKIINDKKDDLNKKDLAIMVCHYGQGITDIVNALKETIFTDENGNYRDRAELPLILFSSTIMSDMWLGKINDILNNINYIIAEPIYPKEKKDVVKDFAHAAFSHFIRTIEKKNNEIIDFHTAWITIECMNKLSHTFEDNGDTIINMKVEHNIK